MSVDPLAGEDLGATLREALARIGGPATDPQWVPFALGWATVELDRAERAFATALGATFEGADVAPDTLLLGARCRTIHTGDPGLPTVVLLEPFTEGRLAATLARHGEGPAAAWLRALSDDASRRRSVVSPGPFGPEVLLPDDPPTGPYRLLVLPVPGTITP